MTDDTVAWTTQQLPETRWSGECPECRNGKHDNCTGQTLDEVTDEFVPCSCSACSPRSDRS